MLKDLLYLKYERGGSDLLAKIDEFLALLIPIMKVVILYGGKGTRLREETEFRPKPMVPIGNRPILWHIMKTYVHYWHKEFILCLGYKGDVDLELYSCVNFTFHAPKAKAIDFKYEHGTDMPATVASGYKTAILAGKKHSLLQSYYAASLVDLNSTCLRLIVEVNEFISRTALILAAWQS